MSMLKFEHTSRPCAPPHCDYGTCNGIDRCGGCCACLGGCLRVQEERYEPDLSGMAHGEGWGS